MRYHLVNKDHQAQMEKRRRYARTKIVELLQELEGKFAACHAYMQSNAIDKFGFAMYQAGNITNQLEQLGHRYGISVKAKIENLVQDFHLKPQPRRPTDKYQFVAAR